MTVHGELSAASASAAATGPALLGVPVEFYLFGLLLAGVALLQRRALAVALIGALVLAGYVAMATAMGPTGLIHRLGAEWATLANLALLLLGFEVLSNHFERSNLADHLPNLLPDRWTGGLVLLALVFGLSAVLDNIAAAVIGGVAARRIYRGRVGVGFLAAIVASANAGGAGSVIGDTTTTLMWLHGVSPLTVLPAYVGAGVAFAVLAPIAAWRQHRLQPIQAHDEPGHPLAWRRILIVGAILATAVTANVAATTVLADAPEAPYLGVALWAAILVTSLAAPPDWSVVRPAFRGAGFLLALVAAASLTPVRNLPEPSMGSTFGLGLFSSVFDNIPLTALALKQGGYSWSLLAYAVGFGGSLVWFGSSAGVALTNLYPEGRSVIAWLKGGWFIPLAYAAGFGAMALTTG